jgi:catechol 2,3-dioxygenase-like lactoylglutathione lyase family enzyme
MKNILTSVLFALAIFLYPRSYAQVKRVEVIGITVNDMDRSIKFYSEVLGFKKATDIELWGTEFEQLKGIFGLRMRVVRMQLGDEYIELTDYLTGGGRSIPQDTKSNDLIFQHIAIVVSDMDKAYQHLRKFNVEHVSTAPQTLPKSIPQAEGIKAFYFNDPDKHTLELIYFPEGKGQLKWHAAVSKNVNGKLFLGIDHTAIGVSNSDESHKFYAELLGLGRKGDSWNRGIEQEHLNNVEGASLHITGYRSEEGPGIEFLQYLTPGPGMTYPEDSRANDIWHWQTTLVVTDVEKIYKQLLHSSYRLVSKKLVQFRSYDNKIATGFIVRDPDGHAMLVMGSANSDEVAKDR